MVKCPMPHGEIQTSFVETLYWRVLNLPNLCIDAKQLASYHKDNLMPNGSISSSSPKFNLFYFLNRHLKI